MLTMHSYDAPDFVMCSCVFRPIVTDPKRTEELWISVSQRQAMKEPSLTGQHYIQIRTPAKFSLISAWGDFWLVTRTSHEFSYTNFTTWNYGMSFWANKNSSTILINSREMWKWSGSFLPFNAICSAVDMDQNFMVTQMRVQQQRREGKRRERGKRSVSEAEREWAGFMVGEAPCTRAFLLLVGACLISSRATDVSVRRAHWPAELRQQNQQWVSRGQLREVLCNTQGSSMSWRKAVIGYSPVNIVLNVFLKEPSELLHHKKPEQRHTHIHIHILTDT